MKLIIDIQDFVYNHIKEFNSTQLYELNVITAIKNGTPLKEIQTPCIECSQNCCVRELNGEKYECQKVYIVKENKK